MLCVAIGGSDSAGIGGLKGSGAAADLCGCGSEEVTKVVGLDCEMVGVGNHGRKSILARVSVRLLDALLHIGWPIVDQMTSCILDGLLHIMVC